MNAPMNKTESAAITSLHPANLIGDVLSVLVSSRTLPMAKTWQADGSIKPYNEAKYFELEEVQIKDIHALSALLKQLEERPNACIVRGRYVGNDLAKERTHDEYKQGKVLRRRDTFDDQPLHAALIEVDDFEPEFFALSYDNPIDSIREYILDQLPAAFLDVSFHWQLSNSAGHPDKQGKLKVHLWFWLAIPRTSAELKAWAKNINLNADQSVFNPVQVHYTAKPIFEKGLVDPIPVRSDFFQGETDEVELDIDHTISTDYPGTIDKKPHKAQQYHDLERICAINDVNNETIKDLRSALMGMKPERADNRKSWIDVLEALASLKETAFGDEAQALAHEFSERCPEKYDANDLDKTWEGLNPTQITHRSIFKWAQEDGWINPRSKGLIKVGQSSVPINELDSLPDKSDRPNLKPKFGIEYPPGLAGEIAKYIFCSSRMPNKSFAIAGALTTISHLNGNHKYVKKSNTALNLYQCLIGNTGKGKEDPRKAIKRLIDSVKDVGTGGTIHESVASGAALLRSLEGNPATLMMIDEFGLYLQTALSDRGSIHQKDLIKDLMQLFSQGRAYYGGKAYADKKQNIDRIDKPYINLIGTTTPLELLEGITPNMINNGFLNRILFVQVDKEGPINREPDIQVSKDLKRKLSVLKDDGSFDNLDDPDTLSNTNELVYEEGAHDLLIQFADQIEEKGQFTNLWSRSEEQTIRIAGLLAVGDGGAIKREHVAWAWKYVYESIKAFEQKLDKDLSENPFQKQTVKALDIINNASNYSNDKQFGKFCKRGHMPRGKLIKLLKTKSREVDEIISYLVETKQINQCDVAGSKCYSAL